MTAEQKILEMNFHEVKWYDNPHHINDETVESFLDDDPSFVKLTVKEKEICVKNQELHILQVYEFNSVGFLTFGSYAKALATKKCLEHYHPNTSPASSNLPASM